MARKRGIFTNLKHDNLFLQISTWKFIHYYHFFALTHTPTKTVFILRGQGDKRNSPGGFFSSQGHAAKLLCQLGNAAGRVLTPHGTINDTIYKRLDGILWGPFTFLTFIVGPHPVAEKKTPACFGWSLKAYFLVGFLKNPDLRLRF